MSLFHDLKILKISELFKLQLGSQLSIRLLTRLDLLNIFLILITLTISILATLVPHFKKTYTEQVLEPTANGLKCVENEGTKLWNEIDIKIRMKINFNIFKKT